MQETQETQVEGLSWEDPLGEGITTHSSILPWRVLWTDKPGGLVRRVAKSRIRLKQLITQPHILL